MGRDPIRSLQWGKGGRPATSNKLGAPNPKEGGDGDIQIRQTKFGPKLFAKLGGDWNNTFLSTETDVLSIRNNKGQKTISLNADGTASFGSSIAVGSNLNIAGFKSRIDFSDDATDTSGAGRGNIFIGNSNVGTTLTDHANSSENICIGTNTLNDAQYSRYNIFVGYEAGQNFGDGEASATAALFGNVAIGRRALQCGSSAKGNYNVAVGFGALESFVGTVGRNVCVGYFTGKSLSGSYNTLIGDDAGYNGGSENLISGTHNICIGVSARTNANDDIDAISIGQDAKAADSAIAIGKETEATYIGNTAIGRASEATHNHSHCWGDGVVSNANIRMFVGDAVGVSYYLDVATTGNSWTGISDVRAKRNIRNTDLGLSFINLLRPVKYQDKNICDFPDEIRKNKPSERPPDNDKMLDGLIAQEVKTALDTLGTTFTGWDQADSWEGFPEDSGAQGLGYARFVIPLIKAVQELSAKLDTMQQEINNLKTE